MKWPDEDTVTLRRMWGEGAAPAAIMGCLRVDRTVKSVEQKAHALRLADRRTTAGAWTEEEKEYVRGEWLSKKATATAIARAIGRTRNMVMSMIKRMGLIGQGRAKNPKREKKERAPKPIRGKVRLNFENGNGGGVRKALQAEYVRPEKYRLNCSTCKWPNGDDMTRDDYFCGKETFHGSYCHEHASRAYRG
jgi:GcrA cell cycle regulator